MKPHYTLQEAVKFFSRIGSSQALIILYLADKFDGIFISDFAYPLDVDKKRVEKICKELNDLGVVDKTTYSRYMGRAIQVKVNPDARKIISQFLDNIAASPEVVTAVARYQFMLDYKQTISDKYNL